jgi:hypothetical protein
MQRRSLLDYLPDDDVPEAPHSDGNSVVASELEKRLQQLEERLNAASRPEPAEESESSLSSEIEAILKRRGPVRDPRSDIVDIGPMPSYKRVQMLAPPLVPDLPQARPEAPEEFSKFVEAVYLIGQAANRFRTAPSAPGWAGAIRETTPPQNDDTKRLIAVLKDTIAAFQVVAADLAAAAGEIRTAAKIPLTRSEMSRPARSSANDDTDFFRLQDDLEDLRLRLSAIARSRSRSAY